VFGGVTLFAAFPTVYALTLQVMYLPVMLMLFALVFRGISFEFREHAKASKTFWNWTFALGSILAAFAPGNDSWEARTLSPCVSATLRHGDGVWLRFVRFRVARVQG
jgi:hypothetical protein